MSTYEVFIDGLSVGTFNDYQDLSDGDNSRLKAVLGHVLTFSFEIIFALLFIFIPLALAFLIFPSYTDVLSALTESAFLIALWFASAVVLFFTIKARVFIYRLNNSNREKFVALRKSLKNENNGDGDYLVVSKREISAPIIRLYKKINYALIAIFGVCAVLSIFSGMVSLTANALAFTGPIFAYTYVFEIIYGYVKNGKRTSLFLVALLASAFIAYLLMGVPFLAAAIEHILFIMLLFSNTLIVLTE